MWKLVDVRRERERYREVERERKGQGERVIQGEGESLHKGETRERMRVMAVLRSSLTGKNG